MPSISRQNILLNKKYETLSQFRGSIFSNVRHVFVNSISLGGFFGLLVGQNKQFDNVAQIFIHFTVCVQARFVLKDCIGNNKHCEII